MIVNYTANGWEIITQRTHGLLAAQIASHWRIADRSERWLQTLIAISDHDDAQIELQRDDLLTPQGGPVDFKMLDFSIDHAHRTMDFSISKSRYIALLCSMHLEFIAGESAQKHHAFFNEQKLLRALWRKELGITAKAALFDYHLMEWCDALSLLICQREAQPEERSVEISRGPDDKPYHLMQKGQNDLQISPWPFQDNSFEVNFERRLLPQLSYASCAEFKKALLRAPVTLVTYQLVK